MVLLYKIYEVDGTEVHRTMSLSEAELMVSLVPYRFFIEFVL